MASFFLYLFITFCLGLFIKIIINPRLVFEYPFFVGGMFLIFLAPQAIILYNNYHFLPAGVLQPLLLMCLLCLLMAVIGYYFAPSISFGGKLEVELDYSRLQRIGVAFTILGYVFNILIWKYYAAYDEAGIEASTQPTGIVTIYFLFSTIINLAFPIFLYLAITAPNYFNIIMTLMAALPTLNSIISGGRREPTALFLLSIAFILFYKKLIVPPRSAIIGIFLFAMFFIPATGDYRYLSDKLGPVKAIQSLDLKKSFVEYYNSNVTFKELNVAAHIVDSYLFSGKFNYGSGYWNLIVFRYVPAQFFGTDFKQSLYIGRGGTIRYRNGYNSPMGITPTGIGDSFIQFGFLGCMFFFFQGGFFRPLWNASLNSKGPLLQIFYIICVVQALLSITHATTTFIPGILFYFACLWLAATYAKVRT